MVDAATATFKVTLEVNDPQGRSEARHVCRVGIVFERRADALTIPRVALLDTDGSSNVFVVTAGKAEQRADQDRPVECRQGRGHRRPQGAEQVVVVGQNGLKDGNPVRVVTLEQTAQAPAELPP